MFARAALFAHIQQTLFNVETIEPSGHFSHDVASGSSATEALGATPRRMSASPRKRPFGYHHPIGREVPLTFPASPFAGHCPG
jgi:hypothetical protein